MRPGRLSRIGVLLTLISIVTMMTAHATAAPTEGEQAASQAKEPVLVIGMSGMATSAIDFSNPIIATLLGNAGFANTSIRSSSTLTCPDEGWMSLVASGDVIDDAGRASVADRDDKCPAFTVSPVETGTPLVSGASSAQVEDFSQMTATVTWPEHSPFGTDALAIGPGAAIALANAHGTVAQWMPFSVSTVKQALASAPGDVVVDIGTVRGAPSLDAELAPTVADINTNLAAVLEANAASGTSRRIIVASLGDRWNAGQLHFFATTGLSQTSPVDGPGIIVSQGTRTHGFMTIADIRSVIDGTGKGLHIDHTSSVNEAISPLLTEENHAIFTRMSTATWYQVFNAFAVIGILGAIVLFLIRPARAAAGWTASPSLWQGLAYWNRFVFAFVPAALILNFIPWWRLPLSGASITAVPIGFTILLAAALTLATVRLRYSVAAIALVTLVVLGGDVILGSAHQRNGFMGSLMLTSRRFYGISNRTYLILVVAGLLSSLPWIARAVTTARAKGTDDADARRHRRMAGWIVAAVGLVVLLIDAVPAWGADFGGPPGIIAGFGIAALIAAGISLRWWHILVWLALSAGTMAAVGFSDTRSSTDSHIGAFWSSIGTPDSITLVKGKIRDVIRSFTGRIDILILFAIVLLFLLLAFFAMRRLDKRSGHHFAELRALASAPGFAAVSVGIVVGILVAVPINDSGALMLKEGFYIAVPALVALLCAQHVSLREDSSSPDTTTSSMTEDTHSSAVRGQRPDAVM